MQWRFLFAGSGTAAQLLLPACRQAGVTHCIFRNMDCTTGYSYTWQAETLVPVS